MNTRGISFKSRKWCLMLIGTASGIPWPKFAMCEQEAAFWQTATPEALGDKPMFVYDLRKGHRS